MMKYLNFIDYSMPHQPYKTQNICHFYPFTNKDSKIYTIHGISVEFLNIENGNIIYWLEVKLFGKLHQTLTSSLNSFFEILKFPPKNSNFDSAKQKSCGETKY